MRAARVDCDGWQLIDQRLIDQSMTAQKTSSARNDDRPTQRQLNTLQAQAEHGSEEQGATTREGPCEKEAGHGDGSLPVLASYTFSRASCGKAPPRMTALMEELGSTRSNRRRQGAHTGGICQ